MTAARPQDAPLATRDRLFLLAGLFGVCAVAWAYTIAWADHPPTALHAHTHRWSGAELGASFLMWSVMMVAMMAPTAAPVLLAVYYSACARRSARPLLPAYAFLLGYLLVWTGVSFVATLLQWRLHDLALVSAAGAARGAAFGGALLLGAGVFQLTPWKDACLSRCRSPLAFLLQAWRPGTWGGLRMGLLHGAFCVGCCWALMALMFVGGTMNLLWAAGLMLVMLAEKALPGGRRLGQVLGVGLISWGIWELGSGMIPV